jgi:uncharacterized membrane protein YphA (DoxX/SURF4 family)
MKTFLSILGQFLLFALFLAIFFAGGILGLFHLDPFGAPHWFVSHPTPTTARYFVPSGMLLMTILWLVVLGIEAAVKKLRGAGIWTSVAFAVALVLGLLYRFGWVTPS